jgi:cytochrome c-type biogenesis protein CcmH
LRCVVCQNQNIDDSAAPIARDMRLMLRERIAAGDTDDQAVAYLVARYGNYVLLKPPFQADTWLLWLAPFGVLALGALGLSISLRRRATLMPVEPLSTAEQERLTSLLSAAQVVPGTGTRTETGGR